MEQTECSETSEYKVQTPGIAQKKAYNNVDILTKALCQLNCPEDRRILMDPSKLKLWTNDNLEMKLSKSNAKASGRTGQHEDADGHRETLGQHEISNVNPSTRNAQRWIISLLHLYRFHWFVAGRAVLRTPSTAKSIFKEKMTQLTAGTRTLAVSHPVR
jgi:hypothetical protein